MLIFSLIIFIRLRFISLLFINSFRLLLLLFKSVVIELLLLCSFVLLFIFFSVFCISFILGISFFSFSWWVWIFVCFCIGFLLFFRWIFVVMLLFVMLNFSGCRCRLVFLRMIWVERLLIGRLLLCLMCCFLKWILVFIMFYLLVLKWL